ncbi:unnamed protein product [Rhodiola kirilowii]
MDRFIFQHGGSSFFMSPPIGAGATRFASKPKAAGKKSHSEAESRRRKRINDHLTTLRGILPSKLKTDKATLLMETVQHVKDLQRRFAEVAGAFEPPTESDNVSVSRCDNENNVAVKATVCCEDRPELNRDLIHVIRSVRGKITRVEMASVGGRTKLLMTLKLGLGDGEGEIRELRRGLMAVVENRASGHWRRWGELNGSVRCVKPDRTGAGLFVC